MRRFPAMRPFPPDHPVPGQESSNPIQHANVLAGLTGLLPAAERRSVLERVKASADTAHPNRFEIT